MPELGKLVYDTYTDYFASRKMRGGDVQGLQVDGVQYTEPGTASLTTTWGTAFWGTVNPKAGGSVLWVEFGLTAGFKGSSGTTDLTIQWRAKNKGSGTNWTNLHPEFATANINTTSVDRTWQGYYSPEPNFNTIPFEIQLLHYGNELNGSIAKVKSNSFVKVCFESITPMTISA